jgi:hypothetical protein
MLEQAGNCLLDMVGQNTTSRPEFNLEYFWAGQFSTERRDVVFAGFIMQSNSHLINAGQAA